jgi:Condensation domain
MSSRGVATKEPLVLLEQQADAAAPVRLRLTGQLNVQVTGHRGGEGPVTRGQSTTLRWVTNPAFYTRMTEWPLALPPGTTTDDIAAAMAVLLTRHESLRTTFPAGPEPVQRVARSAVLAIDVYEASDEVADDSVLTVALTRLLRAAEFDPATDLPLRMGIATWQGEPRAAIIVYSHMAVDFASMALLGRQFTALVSDPGLRDTGLRDPGPAGHQPLDQAAAERSARGVRRNEAALRSWAAQLRTMPQCLYAVPLDPPGNTGGESGWLWSRAAALAVPHIAARTGTSGQLVAFAALCTMLAWRTGHGECVLPVAATNRYERQLRGYVGPLAQDCLVSIDTRAAGLDEVVRRAAVAALRGNRNGLVDIAALHRVFKQVEHDRGIVVARHCVFNDLSLHLGDTDDVAPGPDPGEAKRALGGTRFVTLPSPPIEEILLVLLQQVNDELIIGGLTRDAALLPAGEIETLLRGTESLLVAAAAADVRLDDLAEITGVRPVRRGPGWLLVDRNWIELAAIQRLLADALPAPARAFPVPGRDGPGRDGPGLVAYVVAGEGLASAEQAHAACMTVLREPVAGSPPRTAAVAPGDYVVCAGSPADPDDLASWQRQPVIARGSGR